MASACAWRSRISSAAAIPPSRSWRSERSSSNGAGHAEYETPAMMEGYCPKAPTVVNVNRASLLRSKYLLTILYSIVRIAEYTDADISNDSCSLAFCPEVRLNLLTFYVRRSPAFFSILGISISVTMERRRRRVSL